jgi:PAS domain S-box-containing protein
MPMRVTTESEFIAGDCPAAGAEPEKWDASLRQARILIIDDQPGVVAVLRLLLEQDGYREIRSTTDPLEAIRLFGEFQPDLVVLDLVMPALSGWKVLAGLRAIMRADAPPPILVVTSDHRAETRRDALDRGASDLVAKPFDPAGILGRIQHLLEVGFRHRRAADEVMRESEERFSNAFEHAPIGMALVSLDGRVLKVNQMLCGLLGYSEGELLIRTVRDITHPDDHRISQDHVRRAIAGEIRAFEFNKRYVDAHGHSVAALTKVSTVRNAGGQPSYFIAQIQDITEQRRAEESIRMQAQMLDQVGQAVIACDLRGQIIYANRFAEKLYGWSADAMLGRNIIETVIPPLGPERAEGIIKELRMTESWDGELVLRRQSGAEFPAFVTATPLRSAQGEIIGLIGISEDIAARKHAEAELFRSRETLRSILDQIPQRVFWKDRDSVLVGCNQAFAADMGIDDPVAAIGRRDIYPTWKAMADVFRQDDRAVMDLDTAKFSFEEPSLARDGSAIWLRTSKMPLHDRQGNVTGILGTYEDVTEHKLAKLKIEQLNADLEHRVTQRTAELLAATREAERANRAKGEFLSRTSHELRTPMNVILGFGQVLAAEKNLGPQAQDSVERILAAGRQLLKLIDEILNISDAESGSTTLSLEPLAVGPLLEETICLIRPLAAALGIELIHAPFADCAWEVLADHRLLKQVLVNFLANAVNHNRLGGEVIVECTRTAAAGSAMVRFSVRDSGPGISAEEITRLFTPLDRPEAMRTSPSAAGQGFGHTLSRHWAEMMGGRVGVESILEEGSTFWVETPLVHVNAPNGRPRIGSVGELETGSPSASTVLYMANDPSNQLLITRILARRPAIRLHCIQTIAELPAEVCPQLILLDLPSAATDSGQMLAQLRAHPRTSEIPVLILSAERSPQNTEQMLAAGAVACIPRPVQVRTLLKVVDHFTASQLESDGAQSADGAISTLD